MCLPMTSQLGKQRASIPRLKKTDRGGFNASGWVRGGDFHLASSQILRRIWKRRRASASAAIKDRAQRKNIQKLLLDAEAAAKSSVLLLSYALELFLKAGLVPIYHECSKELFERDLKRGYSHEPDKDRAGGAISHRERGTRHPEVRPAMRLYYARYPLMVPDEREHTKEWNAQDRGALGPGTVHAGRQACTRRSQARRPSRSDSSNPADFTSYQIDDDGYFSFRCGEHLPPRITVKYSTKQRRARKNNRRALLAMIRQVRTLPLVERYWKTAEFKVLKL
jgi:hypothetical protein